MGDGCNREVAVACPSLYIISVERAAAPAPRSIHGHHQIAGTEVVERGVECIVVPPCCAGQRGDSHRLERGSIGHHIVEQITRKSVGKIYGAIGPASTGRLVAIEVDACNYRLAIHLAGQHQLLCAAAIHRLVRDIETAGSAHGCGVANQHKARPRRLGLCYPRQRKSHQ